MLLRAAIAHVLPRLSLLVACSSGPQPRRPFAGLAALIGTLIALYVDMSHASIGIVLGFSGGVYCWVAIGECMAYAADHTKTKTELLMASVSFIVGAVAIALVLLSHVHCEAPAAPAAAVGVIRMQGTITEP